MRWSLVAVVLVGCGSGAASPPTPAALAKMSPEEQCDAVLPRTERCLDELLVADLQGLGGDDPATKELSDAVAKDLADRPTTGPREARAVNRSECLARSGYPQAVVACWGTPDCTAFVACLMTH